MDTSNPDAEGSKTVAPEKAAAEYVLSLANIGRLDKWLRSIRTPLLDCQNRRRGVIVRTVNQAGTTPSADCCRALSLCTFDPVLNRENPGCRKNN